MASEFTSVRVTREDAETLRRLAIQRSARTNTRITITEAVSLVIKTARPHLTELNDGGTSE